MCIALWPVCLLPVTVTVCWEAGVVVYLLVRLEALET